MDVIYHGNCLDGVFSAFSMFVFLNLIKHKYQKEYKTALHYLLQKVIAKKPIKLEEVVSQSDSPLLPRREEFYLYDNCNKFTSLIPGFMSTGLINYIKKTSGNHYICLVDCYGQSSQNLQYICKNYEHVFVIDHHVSGVEVFEKVKSKNISIIFSEEKCAFELVNCFLEEIFHFEKMCSPEFYKWLRVFESYIRKNDLKLGETLESKQFILGYYSFSFNMNDNNFQIFNQLSRLDIKYILNKGKNIYPHHRAKLLQYASNPFLITLTSKTFQVKFLGIKTSEPQYISDLGVILSEMSCREGLDNLAMFYKMAGEEVKVSFRSRRGRQNPLALEVAQAFGGGGHVCAAGCRINKSTFMRHFSVQKVKVKCIDSIEQLLFGQKLMDK